jgi:hypothetical protein
MMPLYKKEKLVCFHGTNKKAAELILEEGFNIGTYFAFHLEDAIEYGGNYIFEVLFEIEKQGWQFSINRRKFMNDIVRHYVINISDIYKNENKKRDFFDEKGKSIATKPQGPITFTIQKGG